MIKEFFPDGTEIGSWFYDISVPELKDMGTVYKITDYGILNDGCIYTEKLQALIDKAYSEGGGVIYIPGGIFKTGALFFKQGVNLYIEKGGVLMGSDDISDYPLMETRIEGESCMYYPALINADGIDGFTITGEGIIDGNGLKSWKAFWQRLKWNPKGTNKDEQRPRLIFISNCKNVQISNLTLQNSHFWTTHIYKCSFVKYLNLRIFSPVAPVKAPSTDAIDIDVCTDVLVKNCYMEVNDDSVVLKGGKGPWADEAPENGTNERIIVEDSEYGFCHGCLTCGSESVHNRNIILRRVNVKKGNNLLWLKMRPDTPQKYEYIRVEDIKGRVSSFININPWTQFFDLKGRDDIPLSYAENITMKNMDIDCDVYFNVKGDENQYILSDFTFENIKVRAKKDGFEKGVVKNMKTENVSVETV